MPPLPGSVPGSSLPQTQVGAAKPRVAEVVSPAGPKDRLRPDFARELENRMAGWLGRPDSDRFQHLKQSVERYLKSPTGPSGPVQSRANPDQSELARLDLDKLPVSTKRDLVKLQKASEGIEAIFVKKLLSQMRSVTFDTEKTGPMADFAKDMMDQAVADQAAKGRSSIGIARMVFLDTAQSLVRAAIAKPQGNDPDN